MTILLIVACNQDFTDKNNSSDYYNYKKIIIGKWRMCSTEDSTSSTNYNVCPEIIFNDSNFVTLIKPSGEKEMYNWTINSDTLFFSITQKVKSTDSIKVDSYFDEKYLIAFTKKEKYMELKLIKPNRKYWYVLSNTNINY